MDRNKREELIRVASTLIHRQGYRHTTLADVSRESGLLLGSLYYYFRTKESLATAIIEHHERTFDNRIAQWEQLPDPSARLESFLDMVLENQADYVRCGCPVGSLSQELAKDEPDLAKKINRILAKQVQWIARQLHSLGVQDPTQKGEHWVAQIQGLILLSNAFGDPDLLRRQIDGLRKSLTALALNPSGHGKNIEPCAPKSRSPA